MIKGKSLATPGKREKTLDRQTDDFYKFLGTLQGKQIDKAKVKEEMRSTLKSREEFELHNKHLIKTITCSYSGCSLCHECVKIHPDGVI